MDLASLLGLVTGLTGLLVGMHFKGVPMSALANPAAIFIILVGTAGAVMIATPGGDLKKIGKLFRVIFTKRKGTEAREAIEILVSLAEVMRREGSLALEAKVKEVDDPFMRRGVAMLVDGLPSEFVKVAMEDEITLLEDRHAANAQIFSQAGTYAPTLGVLGAVIGLVAALGNMQDVEALGHAISAAFMATMYGIFTGYVLWHPFANKLRRKSQEEVLVMYIIADGILLMLQGENPRLIQEKLVAALPESERKRAGESDEDSGS